MKGVQYVVDEAGNKRAVLIDLDQHQELWDDFCDVLTAEERGDEPLESIEDVAALLKKDGKL